MIRVLIFLVGFLAFSCAERSDFDVKGKWSVIDFQYEFAAANNFELGGTIDEEAMVNEEVSHMD